MKEKCFQKRIEDFICNKCGKKNTGNGYTNHCFACLWSRHLDINPGDRKETCGGMMRPVSVETKKGVFFILHKCTKCDFERKNKSNLKDNQDIIINISVVETDSCLL